MDTHYLNELRLCLRERTAGFEGLVEEDVCSIFHINYITLPILSWGQCCWRPFVFLFSHLVKGNILCILVFGQKRETRVDQSSIYPLIPGNLFLVLRVQIELCPSVMRSVLSVCDRQYLNLVNKDYLVVLKEPLK